jgi:fibronectin type 3 domain-containing protein
MRWHLTIIVFFFAFIASAQEVRLVTFRSDTGVHLRWIGNTDATTTGYHVERSVDGAPFTRLTPQPLSRITRYNALADAIGRYKALYFLALWGVQEERDIQQSDIARTLASPQRGMHFALLAAEPALAPLNGEYFFDHPLPSGSTASYRVVAVGEGGSGERTVATAVVQLNAMQAVPLADSLEGRGLDGEVLLRWRRYADQVLRGDVVGYRVWRAPSEMGPFEETTLQTSVPFFGSDADSMHHTYFDVGVANGSAMYYYVRQVHGTGVLGERSDVVRVDVGADIPAPVPLGLALTPIGHAVELSWTWPEDRLRPAELYVVRLPSSADTPRVTSYVERKATSFIDAQLPMGEGVRYTVMSVGRTDTAYSDTASYLQPDVLPPSPPDSVWARSDTGKITLRWSPVADAVGYRLFRRTTISSARLQANNGLVAGTTFTDVIARDAEPTYIYEVETEDAAGLTSKPSMPVAARVLDITPPAAVQFTRFERNGDVISMEWSMSRSPDVATYRLESMRDEGRWQRKREISSVTAVDTVKDAGTHHYRVLAVDSAGNISAPSQSRSTTLLVGSAAPSGLQATQDTFAIRLRWQAVANAQGYRIERLDTITKETIECGHVDASVTAWTDRHADRDRSWIYIVTARDGSWRFGEGARATYTPQKK